MVIESKVKALVGTSSWTTKSDCINGKVLDYLQQLVNDGHFIKLEFGLESTNDRTLEKINRCQKHKDAIKAFDMAKERGILLGGHIILGLPVFTFSPSLVTNILCYF